MSCARTRRLLVTLSEAEHAGIKANAKVVGMSMSKYLRRVGLGYAPKPAIDAEHIREVIRARGDLGRVGGLLKLLLSERPAEGVEVGEIRVLVGEIASVSDEIRQKVRAL
jgi:hypothetical protein